MRRFFVYGLLLTLSFSFAATALAKQGVAVVGYVNLQRAILEVDEGKRATSKLKKTFEKKQKTLSQREAELKKLKTALEKQSTVAADPAAQKKRLDFQNKLMELQQIFVKEQQELQALEQKSLQKITEKMRKVVGRIGKSGAYDLILEVQDSRLLYAKPHLDLTNEVIRRYNAKHK